MKEHISNPGDIGKRYGCFLTYSLALVLLLFIAMPGTVLAANIVVNSTADVLPPNGAGDGVCTLREAIENANTNSDMTKGDCAAGTGDDTITFSVSGTIDISSVGALGINDPNGVTTIDGGSLGRVVITGNKNSQVFGVGSTVTLRNLIIQDGGPGPGAGISNGGTLRIENCTLSGNSAGSSYDGGGILNFRGKVDIVNSTLSGNRAGSNVSQHGGGGIYNVEGEVTITDSTMSGNDGYYGGGIYNVRGTVDIVNSILSNNGAMYGGAINNTGDLTVADSTLSDNGAADGGGVLNVNSGIAEIMTSTLSGNLAGDGGAISNDGTLVITNSTLSGNGSDGCLGGGLFNATGNATITSSTLSGNKGGTTTGGGGIYNAAGNITITNSIVANTITSTDCYNKGTFTARGHNLDTDGSCPGVPYFATVTPNQLNLGPLFFNGGPTQTHALLPGSLAIDTGDQTECTADGITTDQRGEPRNDGHCDIGSFELVPPAQADLSIAKRADKTTKTGKSLTYTIQVKNNGPDEANDVVVNDVLPAGTVFVQNGLTAAGSTSCSTPAPGFTGTVSCSYTSLASGASLADIKIVVKVTAKGNAQLNNTATVSSATSDPNTANNSATATTKLGK